MYRHGEGGLQLPQHVRGILHHLAVKVHGDDLLLDGADHSDVPVEHPHAGVGSPLLPPEDVVVVAHLHHPVPRPEHPVAEAPLPLPLQGRVQRRLKGLIQGAGARPPAAGGGQHLDLVGGDTQPLWEAAAAQVHHGVHHRSRVPPG